MISECVTVAVGDYSVYLSSASVKKKSVCLDSNAQMSD